jgi:hypothetical protein
MGLFLAQSILSSLESLAETLDSSIIFFGFLASRFTGFKFGLQRISTF